MYWILLQRLLKKALLVEQEKKNKEEKLKRNMKLAEMTNKDIEVKEVLHMYVYTCSMYHLQYVFVDLIT